MITFVNYVLIRFRASPYHDSAGQSYRFAPIIRQVHRYGFFDPAIVPPVPSQSPDKQSR